MHTPLVPHIDGHTPVVQGSDRTGEVVALTQRCPMFLGTRTQPPLRALQYEVRVQ
jgi:hypothetical protein